MCKTSVVNLVNKRGNEPTTVRPHNWRWGETWQSASITTTRAQAFMVMFREEAHGSQVMMCETMSLTAVSITIEKFLFWRADNAFPGHDVWNHEPDCGLDYNRIWRADNAIPGHVWNHKPDCGLNYNRKFFFGRADNAFNWVWTLDHKFIMLTL